MPFLFTQGQAILTRTWVPTQDGPGIRQTYDAAVHVPAGMRAVMSADHVGSDGEKDAAGRSVYRFRMPHAIPPYLIALAVGDLAFRPIGSNTGVYAEPSVVEKAASEFAEVDKMVAAAEKLYGKYRWGSSANVLLISIRMRIVSRRPSPTVLVQRIPAIFAACSLTAFAEGVPKRRGGSLCTLRGGISGRW